MGLGDFISGVFGSKNKEADQVDPYKTDPNAYNYGGTPNGAAVAANQYGNTAGSYVGGSQGAFGQSYNEFGAADQDRNAAYGARGQQQDALGLMAQRAHGQNLISQQVTQQQQQQAAAQQAGMAGSARGPAALAMAQQNQAANTGQATAQLGAQGAIAGAQEQLANEQAYLGGASGIRGQDIGQMQTTTGLGSALAGSGAAQGNLGLGYSGLQNNVNQTQLAANMNQQAQNSANYNAAKGVQAGAAGQNASINQQNALGIIGGAASGGGALFGGGGGGKATGGAVQGKVPYLVGEQGPELVVPNKEGFVLTALQTAALRGAAPTPQQAAALHGLAAHRREEGGPLAQPTWGTSSPAQAQEARGAEEGQAWAAAQDARKEQDLRDSVGYKYGGEATKGIEARDRAVLANIEKQRALGIEPPEGTAEGFDQAAEERRARYSLGAGKQAEAKVTKQAEADAKAYAKGHALASAVHGAGNGLMNLAAAGGGNGYMPTSGYAAPQLLALPSYVPGRAEGGPIATGGMTDPGGASSGELGMGGAGGLVKGTIGHENSDVAGAMKPMGGGFAGALSSFGSGFTKMAGGIDTSYHPVETREDGGPIHGFEDHLFNFIRKVAPTNKPAPAAPAPPSDAERTSRASMKLPSEALATPRGEGHAGYPSAGEKGNPTGGLGTEGRACGGPMYVKRDVGGSFHPGGDPLNAGTIDPAIGQVAPSYAAQVQQHMDAGPAYPPGPVQHFSPDEERAILSMGMTPAQVLSQGIKPGSFTPPSEPLLKSGDRMRAVAAANAPAGPAPPATPAGPPSPQRPPVTFAGGGGVVPAHEVERRGPSLIRAENASNAMAEGAIDAVKQRNEQAAAVEREMAVGQVQQAYARQDGAEKAAAERDEELQQRQADFQSSVKSLSQMSMDPNRFWASRSTGQKIGGMVSIVLGGFLQGARGGSNPGLDAINTQIDRDIKAQEFSYQAAHDTATQKQTAFALAMQKYGSVDAARSMSRAAALDAVIAQTSQMAAMWKGTDAGNRADIALAQLQKDKEAQIAQGIAFVQAAQTPRMYRSPEGLPMTEAEAKSWYATHGEYGTQAFEKEKIGLDTAGKLLVEGAKGDAEAHKGEAQRQVRLPNGEVVTAQTSEQHKDISQAAAALTETKNLIARAKQIREESVTGKAMTPATRRELEGIRADLLTNYGVAHRLGALSESDYKQAEAATGGDLLAFSGHGTDSALDSAQHRAEQSLTAKVSTIPGTSARAQGKMPSSFGEAK